MIEIARQFVLYDEGGAVKKIARYQQYFAIRSTIERIRQRDRYGRPKGGVIWQTQGSGKSLAMVLLGKALALEKSVTNSRIILVTDRIDLDEQIWKTFHQCGKEPVQARTGAHLIELLRDSHAGVITTLIQKFGAASREWKNIQIDDEDLFVLVDESHRSHYGEANIRMQKALPRACFIGFTGTPLMKKDKSTAEKFGGFIEGATYTIRDAVEDKAVVPLLYEGRHVLQEVNSKAVDRMFDAMCEGLTIEQRADLKRKFSARDELNRLQSRMYLIAWDISQHFSKAWLDTGFKGQVTAPGKREALMLKSYLDQFGKVISEVIISGPGEIENAEEHRQAEKDENIEQFWKAMMAKYGSEKDYNRQIIEAFKKKEEPHLLIVVDKLLTGFDAPRNVVLYIARSLKEHNLLQAIARVNRLHPGKDFGYVIDYYGVVTHLHDALELYGSFEGKFDKEDLEGTLTEVEEELKKLPALHDALWDLFKEVRNKKDEESFELALEKKNIRDDFYTRLSKFTRVLKMALSSTHWTTDTPLEKVERYKREAGFFQKLRASVKLRYAEEVDYRDYEKQIQKMLNTYVQADEVIQIVDPVNIFEREAFQAEVDKAQTPRAKADTIANRTKKTITERMDEDPFFYQKFSRLLQQTIDDYRAQRIGDAEYLRNVTEIMEKVRDGKSKEEPTVLHGRDLARALFGALKDKLRGPSCINSNEDIAVANTEKLMADAACEMENIIRRHAIVRWRENYDAQNRMRNDLDDFFVEFQSREDTSLTWDQIDAIVDTSISIAINRRDDV